MLKVIFGTPWKPVTALTFVMFIILAGCAPSNETETVNNSESAPNKETQTEEKQDLPDYPTEKSNEDQTDKNAADNASSSDQQTPGDASATVTRVVDGDTVEINLDGKTEDVRLLLVDTPETVHPNKPVQPFGPEASQFAKDKLAGEQVRIEYDGPKRDNYDRLLTYIWVDGNNFNKMLLEEGLARYAYVYDPPYTHSSAFMKAQNQAKSAGRGIWSRDNYVTNDGFNAQEQQQSETEPSGNTNQESASNDSGSGDLKYNPNGPDRDCSDFDVHENAQEFYEAAGGPEEDPHRLDRDGEGTACDSLA